MHKELLNMTSSKWKYMAMDKNGTWGLFTHKPEADEELGIWSESGKDLKTTFSTMIISKEMFNLKITGMSWKNTLISKRGK